MAYRIGITTYYDSYNEGTVLQAYSVKNLLGKVFPFAETEFVNYRFRKLPLPEYLLNIKKIRRNYLRFLRERYFREFVRNELKSQRRKQLVTKDINKIIARVSGRYDLMVTGSDTVWQILNHPAVPPFPNIYWLPRQIHCKKVALAVSANRTKIAQLSEKQKQIILQALEQYTLIGVRDDITYELVSECLKDMSGRVFRIPDPTFGMDIPLTRAGRKLKKAGINFSKPLLGFNLPDNPIIRRILSHYRKKGFQLLQLGGFSDLVMMKGVFGVPLTPFEWADVYKYLSFCITDRFHGTVFSLKNKCPVMTIDFDERYKGLSSKTYSVLKEFGLENRHIGVYESSVDFETIINKALLCESSYDRIGLESMLNRKRKVLLDFMDRIKIRLESDFI